MYSQFPYNVNKSGGWYTEVPAFSCASEGNVRKGGGAKSGSAHANDWETADKTTDWMKTHVATNPTQPFFVFSGMSIVHPPYTTNGYWNATIDRSKIEVPAWRPLTELHPCDFQSAMLKGCTPSDADAEKFYAVDRRREVMPCAPSVHAANCCFLTVLLLLATAVTASRCAPSITR
jgi:hypothetical protein